MILMAQTTITIDGSIGPWQYSKQWMNQMLSKAGNGPVLLNISSLGGDIDHGLAMHDAIVNHGNVSVRLSGFVASAATVVASGAKTISMNSTAFFLIHKVSGWIDEYGFKNEDELKELIEKFTKEAEENKKIDLVIAKIYANRTGQKVQDIIDLMKKETWLTAEDAKEWGFIDEIIEMSGKSNDVPFAKVAMIEAAGLPPIPRISQNTTNDESNHVSSLAKSILDNVKTLLNSEKHIKMDRTKFKPLLNAVKVDDIELDKDGGCYFNASQLDMLNQAIEKAHKVEQERQDAVNARQAAESERDLFINAVNGIDESVHSAEGAEAKINALKEIVANIPGSTATGNNGGDSKEDAGVDWTKIDSLPHNKEADSVV
ncbi:Clp protease ClpP [Thermophagus sp. OGC60D27]|uniref:Clp protease ClpP n=1 Tax=Thermophagus sp. OGC60D27 TaxID=3458415 RepID=UPI0040379C2B